MATPDSNIRILGVDSSLVDLSEKRSSRSNNKQEYHTVNEYMKQAGSYDNSISGATATSINDAIDEALSNASSGEYTYTEVTVSSAEIKTLGSSPKTLLTAPGANSYYEFDKVIIEYTGGAAAYSHATGYLMLGNSGALGDKYAYIFRNLIETTSDGVAIIKDILQLNDATNNFVYTQRLAKNNPLTLTTSDGGDPTGSGGATGTLLVKIWYKVKTFGTEL